MSRVPRGPINRFEQDARFYWRAIEKSNPALFHRLIENLDSLTQALRDAERAGLEPAVPTMGLDLGPAEGAD